jgi:hypothetical protein
MISKSNVYGFCYDIFIQCMHFKRERFSAACRSHIIFGFVDTSGLRRKSHV